MMPWHAKHEGFALCMLMSSRMLCAFLPGSFSLRLPTLGGGVPGGVPLMRSRIHAPRSTGAVRFGYDVSIRMAPLPSNPRRADCVTVTGWN